LQYPRKKDRAEYGSKSNTTGAYGPPHRQAPGYPAGQLGEDGPDNPYEDAGLDKQRKRVRSSRNARGSDRDAFFVLGAAAGLVEGTTIVQRQCPKCESIVPEVGSFFWLHLSQCDPQSFGSYAEGSQALGGAFASNTESESHSQVVIGGEQLKEVGTEVRERKERVGGILDEIMKANREELEEMIRDNQKMKEQSLRELALQADQMGKDLSNSNVPDANNDREDTVKVEPPVTWEKPLITQTNAPYTFTKGPLLRL
jgi:hypothetical protein